MKRKLIVLALLAIVALPLTAQTIFVPSGTVGTSSNSSVGIGTNTPATKLTLQDAQTELSMGHNADPTTYNRFGFNSSYYGYWTQNAYWNGSSWNYVNAGGYGGKAVKLQQYEGTFQIDNAAGGSNPVPWSTRFFIANTGNVGIGTTGPQRVLHVNSAAPDSHIYVSDSAPSLTFGNHSVFGAGNMFGAVGLATVNGNYGANAGDLVIITYGGAHGDIRLDSNYYSGTGTSKIILQPTSGNVGIGTTAPTHKLSVNGTIRAKEVIVEASPWPDYVFADSYQLAPLSQVESHIKEHKHLPGIPSASEVAERGVSMGDMQARLLAKLEELTLHVIRLDREVRALRTENDRLRATHSSLQP